MGAAENKQVLQRAFEELALGNSEAFIAALGDDVRWTVTGTTPFSRTFEGKPVVLAKLLGPLRAEIDGRMKLTAQRMVAEGDFVVVEARGQSTTRSGQEYNNRYCMVCRMEGGLVRELTEYLDTALVEATFSRAAAARSGA